MENKTAFVDGIKTLGLHNNVVRIEFFHLQADGRPESELLLAIPVSVIPSVIDALNKAIKK